MLDLFSGIGGFSLGLQRVGMHTAAFCEADRFARSVLQRHWPHIPCYPDVRTLSARQLLHDGVGRPKLVCGGFPCQDISPAGPGGGLSGARSSLWFEMLRLVEECRPDWVVAENSPALRVRGADVVLRGLEAAGYACWPLVVGAAHAGAPHRRQRVFILAHAAGAGLEDWLRTPSRAAPGRAAERRSRWPAEPGLGRVVDGLSARMDQPRRGERRARVRALGNAVVPAVAAAIGAAILAVEAASPDQAAAERTRSANVLRNLATLGAITTRQ